ncbi:MAG: PilW family protein, partial [Thermoanaerobaculia bacterium]
MMRARIGRRFGSSAGFTLIEMIIVVFLLGLAMIGLLAVFDASARINKSEQDVADAQGAVRYGIYQMTRVIRMAGAGGLFLTQAVLNRPDPQLGGITIGSANGYDNVAGATVTNLAGTAVPVRGGTDMINVRGVFYSPLLGFDLSSGCAPCSSSAGCSPCVGSTPVLVDAVTADLDIGVHVNDDPVQRPQFAAVDQYTASAGANPMLVIVSKNNDEIHPGCSVVFGEQRNSQAGYNVGAITAPTQLVAAGTLGTLDFTNGVALQFDNENPQDDASVLAPPAHLYPQPFHHVRRAGVLDDVVFFIDDSDPLHPALAQGIRRGAQFDVTVLAEDVEDMQVAYGVDANGDGRVTRTAATAGTDTDLNMSSQDNGDEWIPNTAGETTPYTTVQFQSDATPGTFAHPQGIPTRHCPRLQAVMVSLVAKSRDPDPTYRGPASFGYRVMNVPGIAGPPFVPTPAIYPTPPAEPTYRRRVQTLRI